MPESPRTEIESDWPLMLRVSKVFADPLRVKIVTECQMRALSPAGFFEEYGGVSLDMVSRAFDVLVQYDWIGPVEGQPEEAPPDPPRQLYAAVDALLLDEAAMAEIPEPMRALLSLGLFETLVDRVREASQAGTLDVRPDRHISWTPLTLDQLGWERVISKVDALFYSLAQEQQDAEARLAESAEAPIPMTVALLGFESPPTADPLQ
jgi:hypothetical protein